MIVKLTNLEKYAWKEFSRFIRYRDCIKTTGTNIRGNCYTCGKACDFRDLDAGHFIKSTHKAIKFNEINVHAQCTRCNKHLGGNEGEYAIRLIKEYGLDEIEGLRSFKGTVHKFTRDELEDLRKKYKQKAKELEDV